MKRDDSLWKAILEDVFDDFLRFFIAEADSLFAMDKGFEFLDKELEQLFPTNPDDLAPRYVDKLVRVFLQTGGEQWILIHIEVQGNSDPTFASRMFHYYSRINDKYNHPIAAFAILTDGNKLFKPTQYKQQCLGTTLQYTFNSYKVLEQDPVKLAESNNPFAQVILTAWTAIHHKRRKTDALLEEKISLAKHLLGKQYAKPKIRALMNFLKLYVRFGDTIKDRIFEERLDQLTNQLPQTMGIEEFVIARAHQQGLAEGEKKALDLMIRALIRETDFSDDKIAGMAGVPVERVARLRKKRS
ncbi:hypothetical protein [Arsenicibacter rosenii]|uniref:Transposase (putative) YhgA-like domain-containing protein n=1 Tax=Arsenicibacter rosenii TaxID=1750698 RepID=A0A1S2VLY4_9BACT|nr:hypothetical protein [Arsenicibacter rosenii]OIN59759.1 hypothetical protein BLX24_07840 [Arsenicibacter rosenii]